MELYHVLIPQSLLSAQSIRERETKKVGEEIMELLSKPTAKEQSIAQRFRSQGGECHGIFAIFVYHYVKSGTPHVSPHLITIHTVFSP